MELPEIWNLVFQELLPRIPQDAKDAAIAIDCLASVVLLRVEMGGYGPAAPEFVVNAHAVAMTKLPDPVDSIAMEGARKKAVQSHLSMMPTGKSARRRRTGEQIVDVPEAFAT